MSTYLQLTDAKRTPTRSTKKDWPEWLPGMSMPWTSNAMARMDMHGYPDCPSLPWKRCQCHGPWTLSRGQSLFFTSLVCKNSFNMKKWLSHVFTTAGIGQLNLLSSTLGWSDGGSKWYKLSIGWHRLGYRWVLPIYFKNMRKQGSSMHERCERHPYLKLMASVHLSMD